MICIFLFVPDYTSLLRKLFQLNVHNIGFYVYESK